MTIKGQSECNLLFHKFEDVISLYLKEKLVREVVLFGHDARHKDTALSLLFFCFFCISSPSSRDERLNLVRVGHEPRGDASVFARPQSARRSPTALPKKEGDRGTFDLLLVLRQNMFVPIKCC